MEVPLAGDAPPTAWPDGASPAGFVKKRRFRNWKAMAIDLALVLLGFYFNVTTVRKPEILGILGVLVGVVALWGLLLELPGILIDSEAISLPTNRIPLVPVLSFWRRTVLLSDVRRLTVLAPWVGFEMVRLSGDFGSDILFFASKRQRWRFIALIRRICLGIAVYRSY
jgi:hypothetical protein